MIGWACASPDPTPARFGRSRVTCFPAIVRPLGLGRATSRGCRPGRITRSRVVRRRHLRGFACASASSPATAHPHRSNRPNWALRANPLRDRPDLLHQVDDRAPLLRFVPLQHTSAASRCPWRPATRRSRFGISPPARAPSRGSGMRRRSPLRFFAFHVIKTASLELADVRDGSFDHRQRAGAFSPATHSSIDRTRVPLSSIRPAGAIGETGPHALTRDPASSSAAASISRPDAGHAPTRPFARCSATRRSGHRGPAGRGVLPSYGKLLQAPSRASWLVRRRSWGCALRSFNPADGWSRRTSAAAK